MPGLRKWWDKFNPRKPPPTRLRKDPKLGLPYIFWLDGEVCGILVWRELDTGELRAVYCKEATFRACWDRLHYLRGLRK